MADSQVKPIPEGMHSLSPHLVCSGAADAIAFYEKAFGAIAMGRLDGPQGKVMHAMLRIGDSFLMLADEFPDYRSFGPTTLKGTPVTLHLYVEQVDAAFQRALDAGAVVKMPLQDMFWGDRYGVVEDPFGHRWSLATHIRDVSPDEMRQAMQQQSA